jgi:LacI family transcriptional regulator
MSGRGVAAAISSLPPTVYRYTKRGATPAEEFDVSATMQAIADDLGVSLMTVSLSLNGKGKISARTRQRVLEAAHRLGYRPNAAARATATGRFNAVALLLDAELHRDHLPSHLLYSVQQRLADQGMSTILAHLEDHQLTSEEHMPGLLAQIMADGLLINYKLQVPPQLPRLIERFQIPAVWIESRRKYDCVYNDNVDAARMATARLLELGHRRIAFADNHPLDLSDHRHPRHYSLAERRAAFTQVMRDAGLNPQLIHDEKQPARSDRVAWARRWLDVAPGERPTAVVAYVAATALPIVLAAASLGIKVPGDLSVISFGDQPGNNGFDLTRVQLPFPELGRAAVDMLMDKLRRPADAIPSRSFKGSLIDGVTCAPPRPSH